MSNNHFIIVGAGISGLTLAFYLRQRFPKAKIEVLEKSSRAGGLIATVNKEGFLFECGPRTFKVKRCGALLQLISDLGMNDQLIGYNPSKSRHYLYLNGGLKRVQFNPLAAFYNPIARAFWGCALKEWRAKPRVEDESVKEFAYRRFGKEFTETLLEPMMLGIYGGDIGKLSAELALGPLKQRERECGSLTKSLLKKRAKIRLSLHPNVEGADLFTLKAGMESLITALVEQSRIDLQLNCEVRELPKADHVFLALPFHAAKQFFSESALRHFFEEIGSVDLYAVNFGYNKVESKRKGYGYLIPSKENSLILGAIFDSDIFPEQNRESEEQRLTVMMGGFAHPEYRELSDRELIEHAEKAHRSHLDLEASPASIHLSRYQGALPQFHVGHLERMVKFRAELGRRYPHLSLLGNYFEGASVNRCVENAFNCATRN